MSRVRAGAGRSSNSVAGGEGRRWIFEFRLWILDFGSAVAVEGGREGFDAGGNGGGDFLAVGGGGDFAAFGVVGEEGGFDEDGGTIGGAKDAVAETFEAAIGEAEGLHHVAVNVVAEKGVPVVVFISWIRGSGHGGVAFGLRAGPLAARREDVGFGAGDAGVGEGVEMNADEEIGAVFADEGGAMIEVDEAIGFARLDHAVTLGGEEALEAFGDVEGHAFLFEFEPRVAVARIVSAVAGVEDDRLDARNGFFGARLEDRVEDLLDVALAQIEAAAMSGDGVPEKKTDVVEGEVGVVDGEIDGGPLALEPELFLRLEPFGGEAETAGEVAGVDVVGAEKPDRLVVRGGEERRGAEGERTEEKEEKENEARRGKHHGGWIKRRLRRRCERVTLRRGADRWRRGGCRGRDRLSTWREWRR